ncbi:MAG: MFS transporter [Actinomycetia bacterium]|nr:MFS transporter [Actinomycetes bacterium]
MRTQPLEATSPSTPSATHHWPWLISVGLGALMVALAQTVLIPLLADLPRTLHTTTSNVEWLLTATLLVAAVAVPTLGRMGDMFGPRRMLLVALGTLIVGSLIAALSDNVALLIVARCVQGASAAVIPLGIGLLSRLLPPERAGGAVAMISAMLGVGGALGLPLAGLVAERYDFHMLFWILAAGGVAALIGIARTVPESPSRSGGRLDLPGVVLLAGALVSLLLPLSQAAEWGWTSPATLGPLAGFVVLLAVFGWWQTRAATPLVDLATLRIRPIVVTNVASLLFGFALFASFIGTASYVQAPKASGYGFGSSMMVSGLAMLPGGLCMLALAPVAASLIKSWGAPRTLALGGGIVAAGWLMRAVLTGSLAEIVIGTTIVGIGTGIGYAAMPSLINANTPSGQLAAANSLNTLIRSIGSSLASAVGGSVLAAFTVSLGGFALPSLTAYRLLFVVCGAAAVLAATAALTIPHRQPVGQPS